MKTIKKFAMPAFASLLLVAAAGAARAEFPEKPVEMTVLFGGSAQTVGQVLADQMSKKLGSPVVAVGRKGGGGAIGYTYVHGTAADGYNIVWNSNSISSTYHAGKLPFDFKAFTPIAQVGKELPVLAVRSESGWKTLKEMAEAGKKQKLKIAVGGLGSFTHIVSAALFNRLGVEVNYIPGGQGREVAELLAGRVDGVLRFPSEVQSHVKAGTLKVLCVAAKDVSVDGLDAPTCDKAGASGLDLSMWRGLAAPAGTPPAVIAKLQKAAQDAVSSPEFQSAAKNVGFVPAFLPADQFGKVIASDDKEIGDLMKQIGVGKK
ncbi:MAG: tripartite tricarboxylate transporter substrate binding protein [Xanthobacteraceae bacterium]|jgi:tripartite-type tricarboxylate transporter receptor subunit TctC|uniref:tripartite tricarboxylate transporter substrate binding protein n=1 Tax=Pseudolabrys sp. TaxID=1960880 RepID=UPI003D0EA5AB